jgi:hypothetical protein
MRKLIGEIARREQAAQDADRERREAEHQQHLALREQAGRQGDGAASLALLWQLPLTCGECFPSIEP